MRPFIKKIFNLIPLVNFDIVKKSWHGSQNYEFKNAVLFMQSQYFKNLHRDYVAGKLKISEGYINDLILKEFFNNSKEEWLYFVSHIKNKRCLDIGPCVFSPVATWDIAAERYIIEPLYSKVNDWQKMNLGESAFKELHAYGVSAEKLMPELIGLIDGAIYCRNVLDHTPHWPFILSAISAYAGKGCKLLLWSDIDHRGSADEGHYDITSDVEALKRLVMQLGFTIIREYEDPNRHELNWGCFAEKK